MIVSLLPKANEEWFGEFVGLLTWATRDTDRYRDEAARGFLYALVRVARRTQFEEDRAWAVRCLGRLDDPAVTALLSRLAELEGDEGAFAAAELVRDRDPKRFTGMLTARRGDEVVEMLAFDVMPDLARRRWLAQLAADPGREDWENPLPDPGPEESAERLARFGVRFRDEDREALATALPVDHLPLETLSWFFSEVSASPLDGPARSRVLARLREFILDEDADLPEDLFAVLGLIEVRDRDALISLLSHWVEHREGGQRESALFWLARLGVTRFAAESIAIWPGDLMTGGWLGRVRDPRVEAFLRKTAREVAASRRACALETLAVYHGLPEHLALMMNWTKSPAATEKLLAGDLVGAMLLLGESRWLARSGLVNDPRTVEFLRSRRATRTDCWEAVAGLVRAVDADAIAEVEGLVRDGRIWMYYPLQDARVLTFGRDPAWIDFWIDRVDATCCIGFSALETLGGLFPLLCVREVGNRTEVKDLLVDWWRKHRGRLKYSRILDGWVPVPSSGK